MVAYRTLVCLSLAFGVPASGFAEEYLGTGFYRKGPADLACVGEAARREGVPLSVLLAVHTNEGGKNNQYVRNKNGSFDLGHFQINTIHWKPKGGVFYGNPVITPAVVATYGCYNAQLAAWLIRRAYEQSSKSDYWSRIADYHSRTPYYNRIYREKLIIAYMKWDAYLKSRHLQQVASTR